MEMIPVHYFLILSAFMFVVGIMGVIIRKNALVVFMSLEMMFNAANLIFVAYSAYFDHLEGQLMVFFVMTVAAAEVAIGLALIVAIFKSKHSIDIDQMSKLKG